MLRKILATTVGAIALTTAANADCKILGIQYATGASTYDPAGTKIYCNTHGSWQTAPVWQYPEIAAGYRFQPIPPLPRNGFELRQRQSAHLYYKMQRQYDYWLGDW